MLRAGAMATAQQDSTTASYSLLASSRNQKHKNQKQSKQANKWANWCPYANISIQLEAQLHLSRSDTKLALLYVKSSRFYTQYWRRYRSQVSLVSPGWWRPAEAPHIGSWQLWRLSEREAECQPPPLRLCDPHKSPAETRNTSWTWSWTWQSHLIGQTNKNTPGGGRGQTHRVQ